MYNLSVERFTTKTNAVYCQEGDEGGVCAIADSNSSRPKHKELIHSVICYLTGAEMCEKPPSQISERGGRIQMQDA